LFGAGAVWGTMRSRMNALEAAVQANREESIKSDAETKERIDSVTAEFRAHKSANLERLARIETKIDLLLRHGSLEHIDSSLD